MNPGLRITAENICLKRGERAVLDSVEFNVVPGEVVGLLGPNGAGKSTLLSILAGVARPDSGVVSLGTTHLGQWAAPARARAIGYLPQHADVYWSLTVWNVVALGRLPHRDQPDNTLEADHQAIEQALRRTEMLDFAERPFNSLSGGERMRVLVARLLAVGAGLLLADEPVTGLDPYYQLEFMDLFVDQAAGGAGVVLVLHDLALAARYCSRLVLLNAGTVIAAGAPAEVLADDRLHEVYRIDAVRGVYGGQPFLVPWQRSLS